MSTTTGGWSARGMRAVAAVSGGSTPRPSRRLVMQRVEGSKRGPTSPSQRLYYLLYKGQSNDSSCPKPDRTTQRSSLDEIAVSKW